jgi:hypothetical protein
MDFKRRMIDEMKCTDEANKIWRAVLGVYIPFTFIFTILFYF